MNAHVTQSRTELAGTEYVGTPPAMRRQYGSVSGDGTHVLAAAPRLVYFLAVSFSFSPACFRFAFFFSALPSAWA